jgi:hypothetical protein
MEANPYQTAQAMTQLMDSLGLLREAAGGYRKQLLEDGWPDVDASRVAADLLILMQRRAFQQ